MENNIQRTDWIDIAKGIVIILMVCGHTSIPEPISKYIWSFHMPFFFLLSGFLFNQAKYARYIDFLRRRFHTLLVPFLYMSCIVVCTNAIHNVGLQWSLNDGWISYPLWFVQTLFLVELFIYGVSKMGKKVCLVVCFVLLILGYSLSVYHITLPYKLSVVPWACFFYGMGFIFKKFIWAVKAPEWLVVLILVTVFILAQLNPKLDMCFNFFGNPIINNCVALLGILSILLISKYISIFSNSFCKIVQSILIWTGRNTLIIMGFSSLLLAEYKDIMSVLSLPSSISSVLRHIFVWITMWYLSIFFTKYFPAVIGKNKS